MIREKHLVRALELALSATGEEVSPMSELIEQPARVLEFPNKLNLYSFFAADLTFREDGAVILQESNGSNGASTGILSDGQARRARHLVRAATSRGLDMPCVLLLAHASHTGLKAEFFARQSLVVRELEAVGFRHVRDRVIGETLGDEEITVVIGPISKALVHLEVQRRELLYMGRRVGFATNANVLPGLQREGKLATMRRGFDIDTSIFHEGTRGVEIALDKSEQQRVAVGTGITPLRYANCPTWESAITAIEQWNKAGQIPVAKISNGSQGIGIGFFYPQHIDSIGIELRRMREAAYAVYGSATDLTSLPIRLFEFAASTRYRLPDGEHLWDVRVECHVSPGVTTLIPTSMRICPGPFNVDRFDREAVISNLSGRPSGLDFVRAPFARHASGQTELEWAGVGEDAFARALQSLANWVDAALESTHDDGIADRQPA